MAIAFTPPYSGLFEVCADYTYYSGSTNLMLATFQLVETPNSSTTILQEGGIRTGGGGSITNLQNLLNPFKTCGTFKFSDTSKRTIRLMYEQSQASGVASSLFLDRDASNGQRDLHWTVRPVLQNSLRAILTGDQVTSPNVKNPIVFGYQGSVAGGLNFQIGDIITTHANPSAGQYTDTFNKTFSKLVCSGTVSNSYWGSSILGVTSCQNCNTITYSTCYYSACVNSNVTMNCLGY